MVQTLAERAASDCYYVVTAGDLGPAKLIPELAVYIQAAIDEAVELVQAERPAADCKR